MVKKGVETVSWETGCMGSRGLLDSFSDEAGFGNGSVLDEA
jgi:hypothetical protein